MEPSAGAGRALRTRARWLGGGAAACSPRPRSASSLLAPSRRPRAAIRDLTSVCFRIIEIPERRVGALLGPSGSHIKNLQEVLRVKLGVADNSNKPGSRFVRCAPGVGARALVCVGAAASCAPPDSPAHCIRQVGPLSPHFAAARSPPAATAHPQRCPAPPLPRSIWGAPLNVKVAVDVVLLATGLLQQQLSADGGGSSAPSTPRSTRFPSSLSPSIAPSVNGDAE